MTKITLSPEVMNLFLKGASVMLYIREDEGYDDTNIEEALVDNWPNSKAWWALNIEAGMQELNVNGLNYTVQVEVVEPDPEVEYRTEWYMQRCP